MHASIIPRTCRATPIGYASRMVGDLETSALVARRERTAAPDQMARGLVAALVGSVGVIRCGLFALLLLWMHTPFAAIPVIATVALAALGAAGVGNVIGGARDHVRAGRV